MPMRRARPVWGKQAESRAAASGASFSTREMARARARASPERRVSTSRFMGGYTPPDGAEAFDSIGAVTLGTTPRSLKVGAAVILLKDVLRADGVDAHVAVHELRDVDIDGDAGEHVCVVAGEMLLRDEEVDHVADGHFRGGLQVRAEAHADVAGGRLSARPEQMLILVDNEAEGAGEEGLQRRNVDFAIALTGVPIADFEERSFRVDGNVEGGSGDEFLV